MKWLTNLLWDCGLGMLAVVLLNKFFGVHLGLGVMLVAGAFGGLAMLILSSFPEWFPKDKDARTAGGFVAIVVAVAGWFLVTYVGTGFGRWEQVAIATAAGLTFALAFPRLLDMNVLQGAEGLIGALSSLVVCPLVIGLAVGFFWGQAGGAQASAVGAIVGLAYFIIEFWRYFSAGGGEVAPTKTTRTALGTA